MGMNYNSIPRWLEALLGERFFSSCLAHPSLKKNEKNIFCLHCCASFCPHCVSLHPRHRLLQIRRYVYHDVLRLSDAQKLMNCSLVQPYTTNSEKVVFLKERPTSKQFRGSGKFCSNCDRSLQPPFIFCSLSCKVHHLISTEDGIQNHLHGLDYSPSSSRNNGVENLSDSELYSTGSLSTSMSSDPSGGATMPMRVNSRASSLFDVTELTKKKRIKKRICVNSATRALSKHRCSPEYGTASAINRRKGVPQRSPLS